MVIFDVDGTIVDTPRLWLRYVADLAKCEFNLNFFNYYESFEEILNKPDLSKYPVYDFWDNPCLYDGLTPFEKAVEFYEELKNNNEEVLFVSDSNKYPNHIKSKINFINFYFRGNDGFISTDKKWHIKADMIIDDNPNILGLYKYYHPEAVLYLSDNFYNKTLKKQDGIYSLDDFTRIELRDF